MIHQLRANRHRISPQISRKLPLNGPMMPFCFKHSERYSLQMSHKLHITCSLLVCNSRHTHKKCSRVATTIGPTKPNKSIFIILISDCHVHRNRVCRSQCCVLCFFFHSVHHCIVIFLLLSQFFVYVVSVNARRGWKKTHLNAIFIALSWNISVNLLVVFRVACVHYKRVHMLPLYLFALALSSQLSTYAGTRLALHFRLNDFNITLYLYSMHTKKPARWQPLYKQIK